MVDKYELTKTDGNEGKKNATIRPNISTDSDNFVNKLKNKFLSKKKQEVIMKEREKEGIQSIADGAFPVAGVDYNFSEVIRFMEIYDLIRKSHVQEYDAQGKMLNEYQTDNFSNENMKFNEHAPNLFKFVIETVPTYRLTMPLSKEDMFLVQYEDTKEVDVLKLKEIPKKGVKMEFTAFELSDLLEAIKKTGFNLRSFVREEVGETYAGKSKRGF